MQIRITLGKLPWTHNFDERLPYLERLHARLMDLFSPYAPKLLKGVVEGSHGYPTHEMVVPPDDLPFEKLVNQFDMEVKKHKPRIGGFFTANPTLDEAKRARFIEPLLFGDSVDLDSNGRPLNPPRRVLCEACKFPDITCVPAPLVVSKAVLKKQEVFRVSTGMLVVRPRVMKLLHDAIGTQIESGEAIITNSKERGIRDDSLFWVRPKEMIGDRVLKKLGGQCPVCKRFLKRGIMAANDHVNRHESGLFDMREWVEHFGDSDSDFALLAGYNGWIEDGKPHWYWPIVMSGALVAHLKANGVTGIAASTSQSQPECFFSKQRPTIELELRTFGAAADVVKVVRKDKVRIEDSRKLVTSFDGVPWDCDKEGYIYLYLTTPEFMVLDPMTWEEDSGGPYRVPKFRKPGLYRLHVKAIKDADGKKRGVAVDSATLLLVDNASFAKLQDHYDWSNAVKANGSYDWKYHDEVVAKIGSRFAICSAPPKKFKSEFVGDGFYTIDTKAIGPSTKAR
jgi:hypothetical protein